jgi:hypothetical protein
LNSGELSAVAQKLGKILPMLKRTTRLGQAVSIHLASFNQFELNEGAVSACTEIYQERTEMAEGE